MPCIIKNLLTAFFTYRSSPSICSVDRDLAIVRLWLTNMVQIVQSWEIREEVVDGVSWLQKMNVVHPTAKKTATNIDLKDL